MKRGRTRLGAAIVAGAALVFVIALTAVGEATHTPANKVWADGNNLEWMATDTTPNDGAVVSEPPPEQVLMVGKARYNNTTDLRLSVTSECALWTNTATTGDDDAESKGRVVVWVTIDGKPVPVANETADYVGDGLGNVRQEDGIGRVVFCNRAARMKTEQIEKAPAPAQECSDPIEVGELTTIEEQCTPEEVEDADLEDDVLIRSYNQSRSANAFNWGALDIGANYDVEGIPAGTKKGVVEIKVHARLVAEVHDTDTSDNDNEIDSPAALAAIGRRTLFVEPVNMANDADL